LEQTGGSRPPVAWRFHPNKSEVYLFHTVDDKPLAHLPSRQQKQHSASVEYNSICSDGAEVHFFKRLMNRGFTTAIHNTQGNQLISQ
jgi:hypothetical protein